MANILYIDDILEREKNRKVFIENVKNLGHNPLTAVNGLEGWNIINTQNVDLIFTDWDMPKATGYQLLMGMNDKNFKIHLVVCSTYVDTEKEALEKAVASTKYQHVIGYCSSLNKEEIKKYIDICKLK